MQQVATRTLRSINIATVQQHDLSLASQFVRILDGQDRSSYSVWIEGLSSCGFTEHAYVTMPTAVAGDLHHRLRLLSVHTRGAFHPAAALMRLFDIDSTIRADIRPNRERTNSVFAFNTGASETRASAKGGVCPVFGSLPAYNTSLNVALFLPTAGAYFKLSPSLASAASGLPHSYQDIWSLTRDGTRKRPNQGNLALALASETYTQTSLGLRCVIAARCTQSRQAHRLIVRRYGLSVARP